MQQKKAWPGRCSPLLFFSLEMFSRFWDHICGGSNPSIHSSSFLISWNFIFQLTFCFASHYPFGLFLFRISHPVYGLSMAVVGSKAPFFYSSILFLGLDTWHRLEYSSSLVVAFCLHETWYWDTNDSLHFWFQDLIKGSFARTSMICFSLLIPLSSKIPHGLFLYPYRSCTNTLSSYLILWNRFHASLSILGYLVYCLLSLLFSSLVQLYL